MSLKLLREGDTSYLQDHNLLKNLDATDQHPIDSIIGLREELDKVQPIEHIEGLREELDSKYVKPEDGIPLSDLAVIVLTQKEFADFLKDYISQIAQLLQADDDLIDYIYKVEKDLNDYIVHIDYYLKELSAIVNGVDDRISKNETNISVIKEELLEIEKDLSELFKEVLDQLSKNERMIVEFEQVKHMIIDLNKLVSMESKRINKNHDNVQQLAEAHKALLRRIETGDICDEHIINKNHNQEYPNFFGRVSIEQVDKVNVNAGYSFDINTRDNNLRVIEPTVLKLSVDESSGVDILSDFDYNKREDFIATKSVIIDGGIRISNDVAIRGSFKESNGRYSLYCFESLDGTPYKDLLSLYVTDGYILIEDNGTMIKYLNNRLEIRYMDLSSTITDYEDMKEYGNTDIDLNLNMAYRRLDFKVRKTNIDSSHSEYEIPANLLDFSKELIIKSHEECLEDYR